AERPRMKVIASSPERPAGGMNWLELLSQATRPGASCRRLGSWPPASRSHRAQVPDPNQVARSQGEGEHPIGSGQPLVSELPRHADRLQSAKDLFHSLPHPLAHLVAGIAGSAAIESAVTDLLSHVGVHVLLPQLLDKACDVVALVGT